MDGFYVVPGARVPFYYFPSQAHASGMTGGKWVPWDSAPQQWKDATNAAGQRGKSNQSTQTGPQPTGRDPFNSAPGTSKGPLDMGRPAGTQTGMPKSSTGGGFLDDTSSGPKKLGREILEWFGKDGNWKDVAGGLATAYGIYSQRQRQNRADEASDEGVRFAREDWESRAPLRDRFMEISGGAPRQARDLSAAFADPSNPFSQLPEPWSPNAQRAGLPRKLDLREMLRNRRLG